METFKMKITQTTTSTKEVDIKIPTYRKDSINHYKVYSESSSVKVCNGGCLTGIENTFTSLAFNNDTEDCTESEFIDAYNEVKNKLEDLVLKS